MPRLWSETIEAHRRDVRRAIVHVAAQLMAKHGLHAVTMSQIAEDAGIGRATLYKHFPDVEAILIAWHDRLVDGMLEHLAQVQGRAGSARERVHDVLEAYALMVRERPHGAEVAALLRRREHLAQAHRRLDLFIRDLLAEAASAGDVRDDVAPDELASYCLHALAAANSLPSTAAVGRLVTVTLDGLGSPRPGQKRRIGAHGTKAEGKTGPARTGAGPAAAASAAGGRSQAPSIGP